MLRLQIASDHESNSRKYSYSKYPRAVPSGLFSQILVRQSRTSSTSSGFRDTWVWKATQKLTWKPREGLHYHRLRHPWTSLPLVRPSNGINRASLTTDTSATHMPESTGCSPAVQPDSSAGNATGTGTSALRWPSYALGILRCWPAISTGSGAGTPPPVHTATALTRRQSTWCSGVQLMTRPEETSGWEDYSTRIHASGSSWSGLGR